MDVDLVQGLSAKGLGWFGSVELLVKTILRFKGRGKRDDTYQ